MIYLIDDLVPARLAGEHVLYQLDFVNVVEGAKQFHLLEKGDSWAGTLCFEEGEPEDFGVHRVAHGFAHGVEKLIEGFDSTWPRNRIKNVRKFIMKAKLLFRKLDIPQSLDQLLLIFLLSVSIKVIQDELEISSVCVEEVHHISLLYFALWVLKEVVYFIEA